MLRCPCRCRALEGQATCLLFNRQAPDQAGVNQKVTPLSSNRTVRSTFFCSSVKSSTQCCSHEASCRPDDAIARIKDFIRLTLKGGVRQGSSHTASREAIDRVLLKGLHDQKLPFEDKVCPAANPSSRIRLFGHGGRIGPRQYKVTGLRSPTG